MKRKNIFEIISSQRNPLNEIERIEQMLTDSNGVYIGDEIFQAFTKGTPSSIVDYIDNYLFKTWKARETCICIDDLKQLLNLDDLPSEDEVSEEFILIYCTQVSR